MTHGIEARLRHQAATLEVTELVTVYPSDVVEVFDALKAQIVDANREVESLRRIDRQRCEELDELREMSDAVERLRDVGKVIGCDHVDSADGRLALVKCVEECFADTDPGHIKASLATIARMIRDQANQYARTKLQSDDEELQRLIGLFNLPNDRLFAAAKREIERTPNPSRREE
jgi:hypothetical protein